MDVARPRSAEKERAILAAAVRTIAAQGPGAATALIAREAGISNGALFTYFGTKADLLNRLYLDLKTEVAAVSLGHLPDDGSAREHLLHMWTHWLRWATGSPEKRRTLAHLDVSDDITAQSRQAAHQAMAGIARLLAQVRQHGPMQDVPLPFVLALMNALADTTTDFMTRDPAAAAQHSRAGFEALWRMIA